MKCYWCKRRLSTGEVFCAKDRYFCTEECRNTCMQWILPAPIACKKGEKSGFKRDTPANDAARPRPLFVPRQVLMAQMRVYNARESPKTRENEDAAGDSIGAMAVCTRTS